MGFGYRERSFWYHLHPSCTEGSLSLFTLFQTTPFQFPIALLLSVLSHPVPIFSLLIPTSTYLLTFLSRPAFTVLTLCSCTENLFTIVTNQYGIISLSSSFLFSCLLSCKSRAMKSILNVHNPRVISDC